MNLEKPQAQPNEVAKIKEEAQPEKARTEKPRTTPDENITQNEAVVAYKDKIRAALKNLGMDFFNAYQKTAEDIKAEVGNSEALDLSPYWHVFMGSTGIHKETVFNPEVDEIVKRHIDELAAKEKNNPSDIKQA